MLRIARTLEYNIAMDDPKQHAQKRDNIIKLNVGGQHFTTYESTLYKSPYFRALCSGKFGDEQIEDGRFFIDRDGEHFKYLLNFLRCGFVEVPTASAATLHQEALYFQIPKETAKSYRPYNVTLVVVQYRVPRREIERVLEVCRS